MRVLTCLEAHKKIILPDGWHLGVPWDTASLTVPLHAEIVHPDKPLGFHPYVRYYYGTQLEHHNNFGDVRAYVGLNPRSPRFKVLEKISIYGRDQAVGRRFAKFWKELNARWMTRGNSLYKNADFTPELIESFRYQLSVRLTSLREWLR